MLQVHLNPKLFTGKRLELDSGLVATDTLLGWTLMGKVPGEENENSCLSTVITSMLKFKIS